MATNKDFIYHNRSRVTERWKSRRYCGLGRVCLTLQPGVSSSKFVPERRIWKIIQPKSPRISRGSHQAYNENTATKILQTKHAIGKAVKLQSKKAPLTKTPAPKSLAPSESNEDSLFRRSNTEVQGTSHCAQQRNIPANLLLPKVNRPNCLLPAPRKDPSIVEYKAVITSNASSDEAKSDKNEGNINVAELTNSDSIEMGVDTTATRGGTLSQPCISVRNVGATQIFPHLFLGSQKDVVDEDMMRSNGITYVLNVSRTCTKPGFIQDSHFHRISVHDNYQENMTPHIREAIDFIEKVRKSNQRVIVHCLAGVSRSATVAIAYVLHYLRISFDEAYRFVKEKRPSISPNFNFLGQLMDFENSLIKSGYLTNKTTGSLSDSDPENDCPTFTCPAAVEASATTIKVGTTPTRRASLKLNFFQSKTDAPALVMPVTCSFKSASRQSGAHQSSTMRTSPTSLCKRRNGPTFTKGAFHNGVSGATGCASPLPKFADANAPFRKAALALDVSASCRQGDASRRLGSDGFEKYESMACDSSEMEYTTSFSPSQKQLSVVASEDMSMDCAETITKSRTAPSTPVIGRSKSEKNPPWRQGQLAPPKPLPRHRRSASGGGLPADLAQSASMKRRFESGAEPSVDTAPTERPYSSPVALGSSFGSYYNHSEPSARSPHKFVSVNARSPKVLRKSFQLNVRPVYGQAKGVLKSEEAAAPVSAPSALDIEGQAPVFDCTHTMPEYRSGLKLTVPSFGKDSTAAQLDNDATLVSGLTISSPNADGAMRFPKTCPVMSGNDQPRFACKGPFSCSPGKTKHRLDSKTGQGSVLASPDGLKLKWRCNLNRRRQSVDSGYASSHAFSHASSQASSSFTSPTSQQVAFAGSPDDTEAHTPSPSTCHAEGAMFAPDDVSGSGSDSDSHKSNVRQRNALELISCS